MLTCNCNVIETIFLISDILLGWFNNSSECDVLDFFDILELVILREMCNHNI